MTQVRWASAVVGIVVLVAGCRVDARFDITMRDDGSGTLRATFTVDADAVQQLGGSTGLAQTVPLDDLRTVGWTISPWTRATRGSQTITLSHPVVDQRDLVRRVVDLAGPHGILQNPTVTRERGWFSSRDTVSVVVDVRSPSVDIVHDAPLAARLRAAGFDPALLERQLAVQLKSALHVSVVVHLPGGHTESYDAVPGSVRALRVAHGGTDWDRVIRFVIGLMLALLAALFLLAASVGARRNRRRAAERIGREKVPDRAALM
ncbi:MAG: hypothetical protein M3Q30_17280 [Actinomycetota bacterium]|nr:hypothetical protein [Actinomycetota bacterium]